MTLNWICPKCSRKILACKQETERGWCSACEVASWPEEKRKAFRSLVGAFARGAGRKEVEEKIDSAIEQIFISKDESKL